MVASLLDKAPNLAGLSRTCEVPYPVLTTCHILDAFALHMWPTLFLSLSILQA